MGFSPPATRVKSNQPAPAHHRPLPGVLSSLLNAVRLPLARPLICFLSLLLSLSFAVRLLTAQSSSRDSVSLDDAVRQLVDHVAAIPNLHGPLRPQFLQDSNFATDTGKDWQDTFRKELEKHRLSVTDEPTASVLRVGLAETPTQLVLSASVRVAEKDEVRLLTFPRADFRAASLPVVPVRLEKQLVYQSPERILDASSPSNGAPAGMALLVYRGADLFVLRLDASGAVQQTISLAGAGVPPSRDPGGELMLHPDHASVLLPGKSCEFAWSPPAEPQCHSAKTTWRGPTVLTSPCDAGGWKLLADGADWTTPDLLQAVPDSSMQKGSASIISDFPGPILSMNGEQNPASALVVTRNLRTGNYEVYKITLACGN